MRIGAGWNGFDTVLAVGDFDRDRNPDLIIRSARSPALQLYRGNGAGGFLSHTQIAKGWSGSTPSSGPATSTAMASPTCWGATPRPRRCTSTGDQAGLRPGIGLGSFSGVTLLG